MIESWFSFAWKFIFHYFSRLSLLVHISKVIVCFLFFSQFLETYSHVFRLHHLLDNRKLRPATLARSSA